MKLFIPNCSNPNCRSKIPLAATFSSRMQLRYNWGNQFNIKCSTCYYVGIYYPESVFAEKDSNATVGGGIIGGLVGLLGGPLGLLIGAGLGSAIGNTNDGEDQKRVNHFNSSY
jgi:hypothetical protein